MMPAERVTRKFARKRWWFCAPTNLPEPLVGTRHLVIPGPSAYSTVKEPTSHEEISRVLTVQTPGGVTRLRYLVLQRAASYGKSTLEEAVNYAEKKWNDPKVVDGVFTTAYGWAASLDEMVG